MTEKKDLEKARNEIKEILPGIKYEDIKLSFFNAKYYSNFNENYNYFFNLSNTFKSEYYNFINDNICFFQNSEKKYNSFYQYLLKKIVERIKMEFPCSYIPKSQIIHGNILEDIKEIIKNEPFKKDEYFNKYQEDIAKSISFGQENIHQLITFKKSNIEEFKNAFLNQIFDINNKGQDEVKKLIEEKVFLILDDFFKENNSKRIDTFNNKIHGIINRIKLLLKDSEIEMNKFKNDLENKTKEFLNKKLDIFNVLLKTQNPEDILDKINIEIKSISFELVDKLDDYIKNFSIKSKDLIAQYKNIFKEFPFKSINIDSINFEKYFKVDEKIGDLISHMCEYAFISSEGNENILKRNGFFGIFKYISSIVDNYNFLWNSIDLLKRNFLDQVKGTFNFLNYKFKDNISILIHKLDELAKISITKFINEKHQFFKELKDFHEKNKEKLLIKLNIYGYNI